MKSWFAEVAVTKRNRSRVGVLSLLTMMIVLFSSGIALADDVSKAPEPTYYHQTAPTAKWTKLAPPVEQDAKNGVQWLVRDADDRDRKQMSFVQFVTTGVAEPFKFAEGLKAAVLSNGGAEHGAMDAFRKQFNETFTNLDVANFGSPTRKAAFLELARRIMNMTTAQLNDPAFLANAFRQLLAELGLKTEEEANRENGPAPVPTATPSAGSPTPTPTEAPPSASPTVAPTAVPATSPTQAPAASQPTQPSMTDLMRPFLERLEAVGKKVDSIQQQPLNPAVTQQQPTNLQQQQLQQPTRVGELDDSAIRKQAQEICDKFAALQNNLQNQLASAINPLKDALNDTANQVAALSRFNPNQNNNNQKNRLEDILPGLIADATKDNRGNNALAAQAPIQPPQRPQQRERDTSELPQPPPPQPEPSQVAQGMPFFPQYQPQQQQRPIGYSLPSGGKFELREAEALASINETRNPVMQSFNMMNPQQMSIPDLVMAKIRVSGDVRKTQAALASAKDKAGRLDEQLEELKEGGRAALPDWVKRQEMQMKNDLDQAKKNFEQTKQMAQAASQQGPEAVQQVQGYMQQQQQEINQKEQAFNQFQAEVEMKVEEATRGIKALAKQRDRLMAAASKLEGQLGTLKEEETQVTQLLQTNMQMQLAALQGAGQQQQQQVMGSPNVNRILGFQGGAGGARALPPSRLGAGSPMPMGATQPKPQTPPASGNVGRPSLKN